MTACQHNYKFILVGNSCVGKTSLTTRCIFDEFEEGEETTRVCQIFPMPPYNIEGSDQWVQVQVWDTLGQEKFHSLAPLFFRRSVGAFLVYDVTSLASFEAVDKWHQQILKNTDSRVVCMLIGNKKDRVRREVSYKTAAEYARKNSFGFLEVSAKTGAGVNAAFSRLIQECYRQLGQDGQDSDPDQPQVEATGSVPLIARNEIARSSLTLDPFLHAPQRKPSYSRLDGLPSPG